MWILEGSINIVYNDVFCNMRFYLYLKWLVSTYWHLSHSNNITGKIVTGSNVAENWNMFWSQWQNYIIDAQLSEKIHVVILLSIRHNTFKIVQDLQDQVSSTIQ